MPELTDKLYLDNELKTKKPEEISTIVLVKVFGEGVYISKHDTRINELRFREKLPGTLGGFVSEKYAREKVLGVCKEYVDKPEATLVIYNLDYK